MTIRISIDAMGGDHGPRVTVPAAMMALRKHPDLHLIMVGQQEVLRPLLNSQGSDLVDRWSIVHASEVVEMDESPALALRNKKDSSMRVAINLVKEGEASACVSAGNTGALMATARFVLKTLPGIDRPAIMTRFPTLKRGKEARVLDLGANVDSSAEHLYQFAIMGSIVTAAVDGIANPKVGLINIGEEDIKGNEQVKQAAELFSKSDSLNYTGYIEGDAIFSGNADVLVCDGFVGNVALKACEGISKLIMQEGRRAFTEFWWTKLLGLLALPVLKRLKKQIDPRKHNGATLLGLNGIVIKSHGSAKVFSYEVAIEEAVMEVEKNIPQLIREEVSSILEEDKEAE
ncbi:MAG: phosphate acyltransferase PlsX [Coxiellaceae bacterium]|nr:phosphate acyltransferase PlsX [Coxiellaceae bacterium]